MRATAILPMACASAAFILSMLVLFAGSSTKFLPTVDLLTVRFGFESYPSHTGADIC
jgi:SUR7/PalI family